MIARPPLGRIAVVAVLLVQAAPFALADDTLGHLFFSPERRESLDRQRALNLQDSNNGAEEPTITVNGIVQRSSGKRTAWINGVPQNEQEHHTGVVVTPTGQDRGRVALQLDDKGRASAKIGETINRSTREVLDGIGDGSIVVNRKSSGPAPRGR